MVCSLLPQSHDGLSISLYLYIMYLQCPCPLHVLLITDHSCLDSFILSNPWSGSNTRFLFTLLELVHSLAESNSIFISSLADSHSCFLDFNFKVYVSSNILHNTEFCYPHLSFISFCLLVKVHVDNFYK